MARAEGTPVAGVRDPVAFVAASLVPAAVLGLPVVRAVIEPGTLVLVLIFPLHLLRRTMGLLLALLFLNLLRILLTLGILLSLFLLLLCPGRLLLLLLLLTPGPLPFFWTGGTGRLRATIVGGLLRTPRPLMTRRFWLGWLPLWSRLRWLLPSVSRRWLRPLWPRLGWLLLPGSRRWLLPLRLGFLFLVGTPRLLFALIVLGVSRGHGLKQQGQDSHVDKSKRFHGADLPHDKLVHPALGARGTITCWIHPVSAFRASL